MHVHMWDFRIALRTLREPLQCLFVPHTGALAFAYLYSLLQLEDEHIWNTSGHGVSVIKMGRAVSTGGARYCIRFGATHWHGQLRLAE